MSRLTSESSMRASHSPSDEGRMQSALKKLGEAKISKGWMIGGAVGLVAAWMIWHFGPDFVRYVKMERM